MVDAASGLRDRGYRVSIVAQPGSAQAAHARSAGLDCHDVAIRFDGAPWTVARLCRYFRQQRVTALITNLIKDLKAAGIAGRLAGVPVILAARESDFPLRRKVYYRWYFGHVATGVLVNSEATRASFLGSAPWLAPERVHLLYKGIDLGRFQPRGSAEESPRVGFVGQLVARKGLRELMAAWELLEAEGLPAGATLEIAGTGPQEQHVINWRAGLRVIGHLLDFGNR
jgi:glycosyltransferase involved in cell wall biosynthesis